MNNMVGFTKIDFAILVLYLVAVLFAGLFFSKKEMKGKEFFKGDGTALWLNRGVHAFVKIHGPERARPEFTI